jgi:hypothetical protein
MFSEELNRSSSSSYFFFPKGPSAEAPDAPQPAALCYFLSTDSLTLCLLQSDTGLLMRPFLCLLVQQRTFKDIVTLASQGLATANNMVCCFSLQLAKSAVWITIKQAHDVQVLLHRSMVREECNYHSQLMPA